jgi:hypothetical protein
MEPEGSLPGREIWGFHSGEDSSRVLLGCYAVQWCGKIPTFRQTLLLWSSETSVSYIVTTPRHNPEELESSLFCSQESTTSLTLCSP